MAEEKSPAVASLEEEQLRQRTETPKGDLDRGLEDTFPASDPVSMTSTGVPTGRADADQAARVRANPDPTALIDDVVGQASSLMGSLKTLIRQNPMTSVGLVAVAAYIYGLTR